MARKSPAWSYLRRALPPPLSSPCPADMIEQAFLRMTEEEWERYQAAAGVPIEDDPVLAEWTRQIKEAWND